jgi:glycosyltransferase involved in cell wall biosynthesis
MIRLIEFDLADPEPLLPTAHPTWVLVRVGHRLLGQERCGPLDPFDARRATDMIVRRYAGTVLALQRLESSADDDATAPVTVSIVVCTRDRPDYLRTCLERLTTLDPMPAELLVVDNAPTNDSTERLCDEFGVRRLLERRPGLDNARNLGWQEAHGDVVAYVDDDAVADRGFAGALARSFQPDVAAVTGLVLPVEIETRAQRHIELVHGGMSKGFRRTTFRRETVSEPLEAFRYGVGTNMAFRREVLEEIGGFDPRLDVGTSTRGGGDLDALYRVIAAGHVIRYEPNVMVRHLHRAERRGLVRQFHDYGTSFSAFLALREVSGDADPRTVRAYRSRWHRERHVLGLLKAIARRDVLEVQCVLAEARGSRGGRAALERETARMAIDDRA